MVEVDLQLTADGHLVAFHDWDLDRIAGVPGLVEETALPRLRGLEIRGGGRFSTLEEILAGLPRELPVNLELKRRRAEPGALLAALAAGIGGRSQILVSSFDWGLLARLRRFLPERPLAPLADREPSRFLAAAAELGAWSVHCHRRLIDASLVGDAAAAGRPVLAYTVNRPAEAQRLLALGVSGLFTDVPALLREGLGARTPSS